MTSIVLDSTDAAFDHDVLKEPGVVLVDFWAAWCGPCKALSPILEKVAKSYAGKARVVKVNADDNRQAASRFGVQGLPTMLIFKNGDVVQRLVGMSTQSRISALLDQHLGAAAAPEGASASDAGAASNLAWFNYATELLSNMMAPETATDWQSRWQQALGAAGSTVAVEAAASRLIRDLLQECGSALESQPSASPLLAALSEVQSLHAEAATGSPPSQARWQDARARAAKAASDSQGPQVSAVAACVQAAAAKPVDSTPCLGEVLDTWMNWRNTSFDQAFGWTAEDDTNIRRLLGQMQSEHIDNKPGGSRDVFMLLREHHPAVEARLLDYMQRKRQWQYASVEQAAQRLSDGFVAR